MNWTLVARETLSRAGKENFGIDRWVIARTPRADGPVLYWKPSHRVWRGKAEGGYVRVPEALYLAPRDGAEVLLRGRLTRLTMLDHAAAIDAAFGDGTAARINPKKTLVVDADAILAAPILVPADVLGPSCAARTAAGDGCAGGAVRPVELAPVRPGRCPHEAPLCATHARMARTASVPLQPDGEFWRVPR